MPVSDLQHARGWFVIEGALAMFSEVTVLPASTEICFCRNEHLTSNEST